MNPMNPEVKERWLEALRSGDYVQGKNRLRKKLESGETGFCCWGVLCDLMQNEVGGEWVEPDEMRSYFHIRSDPEALHSSYAPVAVLEAAGISTDSFVTAEAKLAGTVSTYFASLNDLGVPFSDIANEIEARL